MNRSGLAPLDDGFVRSAGVSTILLVAARIDNFDVIAALHGPAVAEAAAGQVCALLRQWIDSAPDVVGGVVGRGGADFNLIARETAAHGLFTCPVVRERIDTWFAAIARTAIAGSGGAVHLSLSWSCVEADDVWEDRDLLDVLLAEARGRLIGAATRPQPLVADRAARDMAAAASLYAELNAAELQFVWQPVCGLDGGAVLYLRASIAALGRYGQIEDREPAYRALERLGLAQAFDQALVLQAIEYLARSDTHSICVGVSASSFRSSAWWPAVHARLSGAQALARRLFIAIDCAQTPVVAGEAVALADSLRRCGCRIVLQGLGSGQVALSALIALRPEVVTLDALFLRLATPREPDEQLFRRIASLASVLAPAVVAEGVEDAVRVACALEAGVHWGLGSYLARPGWRGPSRSGSVAAQVSAFEPFRLPFPNKREGSQ